MGSDVEPVLLGPALSVAQRGFIVPSGTCTGVYCVSDTEDVLRPKGGNGWVKVECGEISYSRLNAFLHYQCMNPISHEIEETSPGTV